MTFRPVVVGLLAAGCVTAAAGGAYVAVRHNQAEAAIAPAPASTAAAVPSATVAETEAVVTPAAVPTASAPTVPIERTVENVPASAPREVPAKRERNAARPEVRRPLEPARRTPPAPERTTSPATTAANGEHSNGAPAVPAREPVPATAPLPTLAPVETEAVRVPEHPVAPPPRELVEVVVPAFAVMGLQVDTALTSERAQVEDRVEARVTRDVSADGRVAIPAGSRVLGAVTLVERGGKMKERARLGIRFHTLVLADGTEIPIRTESFFREGNSPTGESARKVGGAAIAGAVIGAIIGGGKGAAIGGATGAAGGTAAVMAGDRNPATLPAGTVVSVRLASPVTLTADRE